MGSNRAAAGTTAVNAKTGATSKGGGFVESAKNVTTAPPPPAPAKVVWGSTHWENPDLRTERSAPAPAPSTPSASQVAWFNDAPITEDELPYTVVNTDGDSLLDYRSPKSRATSRVLGDPLDTTPDWRADAGDWRVEAVGWAKSDFPNAYLKRGTPEADHAIVVTHLPSGRQVGAVYRAWVSSPVGYLRAEGFGTRALGNKGLLKAADDDDRAELAALAEAWFNRQERVIAAKAERSSPSE